MCFVRLHTRRTNKAKVTLAASDELSAFGEPCDQGQRMKTMAALTRALIEHTQDRPDATACEFLHPDGELATLSYAELLARARRTAWQITRLQKRARQPVVLLFPPGLGYVTALY